MTLLPLAFLAGMLTVLAPCILPILPVILVRSTTGQGQTRRPWLQPVVITVSLIASVIVFSLLLKASTVLLGVPDMVWHVISGSIIAIFGLLLLFPQAWAGLAARLPFFQKASQLAGSGHKKQGITGSIIVGFALGPIFNSCSPTYALIVASILPVSFGEGLIYLTAYAIGLGAMLLAIAFAGQGLTRKLGWFANPHGIFHKVMATLFMLIGLMVMTGFDKTFQTFVLEQGWYDPLSHLEESLR